MAFNWQAEGGWLKGGYWVFGIKIALCINFMAALTYYILHVCIRHELFMIVGDIAILLHSGMGIKRALCYNFMAALICFAGLVVGILLGEMTESTSWVLAFAGGMFVYISLVDMVSTALLCYPYESSILLSICHLNSSH